MARFDIAKQSTDINSGVLDQRVVHEAIRCGVVARLAPDIRARPRQARRNETGAAYDPRRSDHLNRTEGRFLSLGRAA